MREDRGKWDHGRCWGAFAWVVIIAAAGSALGADAAEPMNRVSFQVESSRDVTNDWIQAVVGLTVEDVDAARLANRVNQTMAGALERASGTPSVRVKSGGYTTHPIHEGGKLRRWRASQQLILESADVDAVTALIGKLQAELQLQSIRFSVSPERRRATENELIAEVLTAFRARAEIVRETLGARSYEIAEISISTRGGPPVRPMYAEARTMAAAAQAPPALEGGSSQLSVHANGTIELE
jgi:predicted secreted protein